MKTLLEQLIAEKELLSDPARWTKLRLARDKLDRTTLPSGYDAVCWCQHGAMIKVSGVNHHNEFDIFDISSKYPVVLEAYTIKNKVARKYNFHSSIRFNDHDDTDHAKLMEFYDKCIEEAKTIV